MSRSKENSLDIVQFHAEENGKDLMAAYDALSTLSNEQREAVIKSARDSNTQAITKWLERYRKDLAATINL